MYSADLVRDRRFWKISVTADNATIVSFGALGSKGRTTSRSFPSASEADEWARTAAAAKEADGYVASTAAAVAPTKMTTRSASKKRVKEEHAASLSAAKKLRRSARTRSATKPFTVQEEESLGEVDAQANVKGCIIDLDGAVCDVMLAQVDTRNNIDNFVILQLICCDSPKLPFVVFKRWGRTGEVGQIWSDSYKDLAAAAVVFTNLFRETAAVEWGAPPVPQPIEHWRVMTQDYVVKRAFANGTCGLWQYWVDDGVDGKMTGWYPFTLSGNNMAEALYLETRHNPYDCRIVRSGYYSYLIDFFAMTQMNLDHGANKVRHIRRVPPGVVPDHIPPEGAPFLNKVHVPFGFAYPGIADGIAVELAGEEPHWDDDDDSDDDDDDGDDDDGDDGDDDPPALQGVSVPLKAKKASVKREPAKPEHTITPVAPAPVPAVAAPKKGAAATKATKAKKVAKKGTKKAAKTEPKTEPESEITPAVPQQPAVATVKPPVDAMFPNAHKAEVVDDFDATLNQTNITGGSNNNKYYRIQLLCVKNKSDSYVVWTRWGRVGESNKSSTLSLGPFKKLEKAIPVFEKKFLDKTGNTWENRANFVPRARKYDLLEVDYTKKEDAHVDAFAAFNAAGGSAGVQAKSENVEYLPSKLDAKTQDLVNMLFEKDLYSHAMQEFDIDTRRMPLGQLTAAQIQRGMDVLKDIEDILRAGRTWAPELDALSSRFYSVIPHDFGRQRPPKINNMLMLQKCFDKCIVLLDIEKATKLMADAENRKKKGAKAKAEKVLMPHPVDGMYDSLGAGLTLVAPGSSEHDKVTCAFSDTSGSYSRAQLVDVWRVDRHGEDERFAPFRKLKNHKLLWHGTNIAVVAAILSSGLRIMPHSGGRCGAGIYLASESGKSQGYTSPNYKRNIGCMFLAEAALGKEFSLLEDDPSLRKAPNQFDSVVARGTQTPASFEQVAFGSSKVLLPSAQPVQVPAHARSRFSQDEYLVYREEQVRLRYVLTVRF